MKNILYGNKMNINWNINIEIIDNVKYYILKCSNNWILNIKWFNYSINIYIKIWWLSNKQYKIKFEYKNNKY